MSNHNQTQELSRIISYIAQEDFEDIKNDVLPFMDSKTDGPNIWIAKSTGDKEKDRELGKYYAALYVAHCHYEGGGGWNIGAIVAAMPSPIGELEKAFLNHVGYFAGNWIQAVKPNDKRFEGKRSSSKKYYRFKRTAENGESITVYRWTENDEGKVSIQYHGTSQDLIATGLLPARMFQETSSTCKKGNVYLPDGSCVYVELRKAGQRFWCIEWERMTPDQIPYKSDKAVCHAENESDMSIRWRKERGEQAAEKNGIHNHLDFLVRSAGFKPQENAPAQDRVIISANGLFKHRALLERIKAAEDHHDMIPIYKEIEKLPEDERGAIEAKWYKKANKLCPPDLRATPAELAAQQESEQP